MAQYNELPVYKATYDLLLAIFQFTKDFSKEYKYTVGESLKKETIELLTLIYRANTRHQKADVLQMAREQIEVIRLLIRVMKDMKQISLNSYLGIMKHYKSYKLRKTMIFKNLSGWWWNHLYLSGVICKFEMKTKTV